MCADDIPLDESHVAPDAQSAESVLPGLENGAPADDMKERLVTSAPSPALTWRQLLLFTWAGLSYLLPFHAMLLQVLRFVVSYLCGGGLAMLLVVGSGWSVHLVGWARRVWSGWCCCFSARVW
jgi:hypothetical protein